LAQLKIIKDWIHRQAALKVYKVPIVTQKEA